VIATPRWRHFFGEIVRAPGFRQRDGAADVPEATMPIALS
jgi:hypothetical protein